MESKDYLKINFIDSQKNTLSDTIHKSQLEIYKKNFEYFDIITLSDDFNNITSIDINVKNINVIKVLFPAFLGLKISKNLIKSVSVDDFLETLGYFGYNKEDIIKVQKNIGYKVSSFYILNSFDKSIRDEESKRRNMLNEEKVCENDIKNFDNDIIFNPVNYETFKNECNVYRNYYKIDNKNNYNFFDYKNIKEIFTPILKIILNIPEIVIAGGIISNILYNNFKIENDIFDKYISFNSWDNFYEKKIKDFDIFLITQSEYKAEEIIKNIYKILLSFNFTSILINDNESATTFIVKQVYNNPRKIKYAKFQVIKRLYNSVYQILSGFDIDSCCVGVRNNTLYTLPRFLRAVTIKANIVDPERQSTSYCYRLSKYFSRNFSILIPGIKKDDKINNLCPFILSIKTLKSTEKIKYNNKLILRNNKDYEEEKDYYVQQYNEEYLQKKYKNNIDEVLFRFKKINPGDQSYGSFNPTNINIYEDIYITELLE